MLATWQQRRAEAPLAGAFKCAVRLGHVRRSTMDNVARPKQQPSIAAHWSPDEARRFLMWQV
jgi:hypothetical protein